MSAVRTLRACSPDGGTVEVKSICMDCLVWHPRPSTTCEEAAIDIYVLKDEEESIRAHDEDMREEPYC